jgi:5-methylcytosine-specific restriction protein B
MVVGTDGGGLEEPMATWWVNQGDTYPDERHGEYLFAPFVDKAGRHLHHWDSMTELRTGDTVIHYANGEVRAVSWVTVAARPDTRPVPMLEPHLNTGRLARVAMTDASIPIARDDIPVRLRAARPKGPFNVLGHVNQVYLCSVSREFASAFFTLFCNRFAGYSADGSRVAR